MQQLSINPRSQKLTDFETNVLGSLRLKVAAMPEGAARFVAVTPETGVRYPERGFLITPGRVNAAVIRGYAAGDVPNSEGVGAEILVTIGEASAGEFAIRPRTSEMRSDLETFMRLCDAVFTSRFSEWIAAIP